MTDSLNNETVYILNSKIKNRKYDGIVLDENDFHPCKPFFIDHPNIQPESIKKIHIKGILEQYDYIRAVLRYCDYMLAVGGVLEIEYFCKYTDGNGPSLRGRGEWHHELSLVFQDRIMQISADKSLNGLFVYKKIAPFLPEGDTINRWSFGIVSNGQKNDRVLEIIKDIQEFNIPEYEVLICGPQPCETLPPNVVIIDDSELYSDIRIPISKKKDKIISMAKYNNIVIMHDRIRFSPRWYESMMTYGNYYDLLCCPIVNEEDNSLRMNDWCRTNLAPIFVNKWANILPERKHLSYDEWYPNVYVPGGIFQIKKHFGITLDPVLNWLEKEDVSFTIRAYYKGVLVEFFAENLLYSQASVFKGTQVRKGGIYSYLKTVYRRLRTKLRDNNAFSKYLNNE